MNWIPNTGRLLPAALLLMSWLLAAAPAVAQDHRELTREEWDRLDGAMARLGTRATQAQWVEFTGGQAAVDLTDRGYILTCFQHTSIQFDLRRHAPSSSSRQNEYHRKCPCPASPPEF